MKINKFIDNYKTLTIDEKINYKDYYKEYVIKNGTLKQDIKFYSINNIFECCNYNSIIKVDFFIDNYGIFSSYIN